MVLRQEPGEIDWKLVPAKDPDCPKCGGRMEFRRAPVGDVWGCRRARCSGVLRQCQHHAAKPGEPERAYSALDEGSGYVIGLATENEPGYHRLNYGPYETEAEARAVAENLNSRLGVSTRRALLIVGSSMFPASTEEHARRRASWDELEVRS
jgi:hypothetical protein